ncbi:lysE type translocator-like protein [Phaeobacter inhibens]|uniref:LysE type translocator-like protein n=1 Tax=Phaeobacter inhibens TaxID=221822 RepID=A0A2I7G7A7_9RHOB|nr:LysE family translocator [Phaeobacter inhibens]AUQ49468.1 lysE type translocator-like protein [Phaeobacter inhibens]AUQ94023.1 lysE type translocator-like protein [Phaeobacter inhibens]AUQ99540.1 lysE type translocator-like protein [Phaeobacter inhibens]AUR19271.1 lysE type translocator-like protein [Phaeobacter inhibens]
MTFETYMTFVLASSALMVVPGPAMLFMIGLALNDGLYRAFLALPGLALGLVASISVSLLGAGAILLASAQLFTALKLIGAAYLIYLGIRLWVSNPGGTTEAKERRSGKKSLFWPAFLVAVLNPKALIFYIAFLPQFVDAKTAGLPQFLVLGATFCFIAILAAVISAFAGSGLRKGAKDTPILGVLNKCGAGAMVASGIITASSARN